MRYLLVALLSSGAVWAQEAPAPPKPDPPKTARVEGVVRSTAGEPVPRATVRLQGPAVQGLPANYSATSDDKGAFFFENIPPGRNYRLNAQRPGFLNAQYGSRTPTAAGTPLTLAAGQVLKDLVINMTPQGVITGRVTDHNGDPVNTALVMLMRSQVVRGVRRYGPASTGTTNDQGEYRLANVAPGRYILSVTERVNPGTIQTAGAVSTDANIVTYYANSSEQRSAVPIEVTPGVELRGIDVRMLRGKMYAVRGRIVDPSGAPPQSPVMLTAVAKEESGARLPTAILSRAIQPSRPDGSFEINGLAPGVYALQSLGTAVIAGQVTVPMVIRGEVTITDKDVNDLVIRGTSGTTIAGSIRLEGGDVKSLLPPEGAKPAATGLPVALAGVADLLTGIARPSVSLSEVTPQVLNGARPGQMQPDGSFKVEGVSAARYRVNVSALPEGVYIKSVTFAGTDITGGVLDLTSGAGGALEIVLSSKAADLTGIVRNEAGDVLTSVPVTLWPRTPPVGDPAGGMRTAIADQNGGFQLRSIPPGEYYLAAWTEAEAVQMLGPDLLAKFTSDAAKVDLAESAHQAVEAKPIPAEKLAAEVAKLP